MNEEVGFEKERIHFTKLIGHACSCLRQVVFPTGDGSFDSLVGIGMCVLGFIETQHTADDANCFDAIAVR
jgi:hypothetical protein